jgi:hypothetical protein
MKSLALVAGMWMIAVGRLPAQEPPKPQKEHDWLRQIVGEFDTEAEIIGEAGQPPLKTRGRESSRLIGGFWMLSEHRGDVLGTPFTGVLTLGYSPENKCYVATWIDSLSSRLWTYRGSVDADGKILTLDTEGPGQDGKPAKFRETIEIKDQDHKVYTSSVEKDGKWVTFLKMQYSRRK